MKSVISLFLFLLLNTETQCGPYHRRGFRRPMYMRAFHRRFRPYGFFDRSRFPPFFFRPPPIRPGVTFFDEPFPLPERGPPYRIGFIPPGATDIVRRHPTETRSIEPAILARALARHLSHVTGHSHQPHPGNRNGERLRHRDRGISSTSHTSHGVGRSRAHVGHEENTHTHVHTPSKTARHGITAVGRPEKSSPTKKKTSRRGHVHDTSKTVGHVGHPPGEHVGPVVDIFGNDLKGQHVGHIDQKGGHGKHPTHDHSHGQSKSIQGPKSVIPSPEPEQTSPARKSSTHGGHAHTESHFHGEVIHHGHSAEDHVGPVIDIFGRTHNHDHHADTHSPSSLVKSSPVAKETVQPLPAVQRVEHSSSHHHHHHPTEVKPHPTPTQELKPHRITQSMREKASPKTQSVGHGTTLPGGHAHIEHHAHGDIIHHGHSAEDHVGPVIDIFGNTHGGHSQVASANDHLSGSVQIPSGAKTAVQSLPVDQHVDHHTSHNHHSHHPNEVNEHPIPSPKMKQHRIAHSIREEASPSSKANNIDTVKVLPDVTKTNKNLGVGNGPAVNGDVGTVEGVPVSLKALPSNRLKSGSDKDSILRQLSDLIAKALIKQAEANALREQQAI